MGKPKDSTRRPPKRRKVYNFECKKKEEFVNKTVNSPVNNEEDDNLLNDVNNESKQQTHPATAIVNNESTPTSVNIDVNNDISTPQKNVDISASSSSKKVINIESATPKSTDEISGNRIIDVGILSLVIQSLGCQQCEQKSLRLKENFSKKQGLASFLFIVCSQCSYKK